MQLKAAATLELNRRRKRGKLGQYWQPQPGPQALAYESEADIIGYGGRGGGGKTDLLLGLAFQRHRRSTIFRRVFPETQEMVDRGHEIVGRVVACGRGSSLQLAIATGPGKGHARL